MTLRLLVASLGLAAWTPALAAWTFTDITASCGLDSQHGFVTGPTTNPRQMSAGVAAADVNGDGWIDLFLARGDIGPNHLFSNDQSGAYVDQASLQGLTLPGTLLSGPVFADVDGDGQLDLFVGGLEGTGALLLQNTGGGFQDVTLSSGIAPNGDTFSAAFGDYDRDGDLDLATAHWGTLATNMNGHLWRNEGSLSFTAVDAAAGLVDWGPWPLDFTFTPRFADIDNDGWPDLLYASDFNTSRVFRNNQDGTFTNVTTPVISDENGMGSAIGDYDNDGALDWFVTSIYNTGEGLTGNRLYHNRGDGTFEDLTDFAGVRDGGWGWGTSFADLNNDMHLDLVMVNGWYQTEHEMDAARVFVSNGDGTFTEQAQTLGLADARQGRGLSCFDFDSDGDLDLLIANNSDSFVMYRNDLDPPANWLDVRVKDFAPNTEGIGARIYVVAGGITQMREVQASGGFVSQDPTQCHFGLGSETIANLVAIRWPDGSFSSRIGVDANQTIVLDRSATEAPLVGSHETTLGSVSVQPNPFRHHTRIEFSLQREARVRARVYDVQGRVRKDLGERNFPPGTWSFAWDGSGERGLPTPPGVYFVELRTSEGSVTARTLRLR